VGKKIYQKVLERKKTHPYIGVKEKKALSS
jgi:hypothetical protein